MTTALTEAQVIKGPDGRPQFAVIPYDLFRSLIGDKDYSNYIPHAVVERMVDGSSSVKAWREHLNLTQADLAQRMDISQAAYSQLESSPKLRPSSRRRIAQALGVTVEQLA